VQLDTPTLLRLASEDMEDLQEDFHQKRKEINIIIGLVEFQRASGRAESLLSY
jgi:hypothetical protein